MRRVKSIIRGRRQSFVNKRSTAKDQRLERKLSLKMMQTPLKGTPGNELKNARQKIYLLALIFAEQKDINQARH